MGEAEGNYEVKVMPTAEEDLRKFDKEFQRRFVNKIEKLKFFPEIYGKPLGNVMHGKWELRFEKRWRIIYIIDEVKKIVEVHFIWHKKDF